VLGDISYEEFVALSSAAAGVLTDADEGVVSALRERCLLDGDAITDKGLEALEPYRVKRAVIMAAGFGSRMVPITYSIPKPLVKVHGKRIIDTILDALIAAGIEEIYVVRGYLAEQFDELLADYPNITFVQNDLYSDANNISSIVAAREHLANAYVCEADLFLNNPSLVTPYQYRSNYLGVPVAHTDDWCFITEDHRITELLIGADDCHHMFGISYWTAEEGAKLGPDAAAVMERQDGAQCYWDEVPLRAFPEHYSVYVRDCSFDDVAEIDTFDELKQIDPTYNDWKA